MEGFTEVRGRKRGNSRRDSTSSVDSVDNSTKKGRKDFVLIKVHSFEVNLRKDDPLRVSRFIEDNVGEVHKVFPGKDDSINILCEESQAKLLLKLKRYGRHNINVKKVVRNNEVKGIVHGFDKDIESKSLNQIRAFGYEITNIYIMPTKTEVQSVVLTFKGDKLPDKVTLGYRAYNVRQYVPRPIRCFKCQRFGHKASKCSFDNRCSKCGEGHRAEECQKEKTEYKCCNCEESHSAAYSKCAQFVKAQEIIKVKVLEKVSYAQAARVVKAQQQTNSQSQQILPNQTNDANTNIIDAEKLTVILCKFAFMMADGKFVKLSNSDKIRDITKVVTSVFKVAVDPRKVFDSMTKPNSQAANNKPLETQPS